MLRRFSINFALLSMLLDGISTMAGLGLADVLRPLLNEVTFIKNVAESSNVPVALYLVFPIMCVAIFASLSIYDGRRFLRAADELAAFHVRASGEVARDEAALSLATDAAAASGGDCHARHDEQVDHGRLAADWIGVHPTGRAWSFSSTCSQLARATSTSSTGKSSGVIVRDGIVGLCLAHRRAHSSTNGGIGAVCQNRKITCTSISSRAAS